MKSAVVGQPGSQLHGIRTKCCNRSTRTGQAVSWHLFHHAIGLSFRERAIILHATCMAEIAARAPDSAPVRPPELAAEMAALRAAAAA